MNYYNMWPFKRIFANPGGIYYGVEDIAKVGENLNFGDNPNIPIFWYDLINYIDILIENNLELQFTINNENNNFNCCHLYYIIGNYKQCIDIIYNNNYKKIIQIICTYNIIRFDSNDEPDCMHIIGSSYEVFEKNNIKYVKHISINIHDCYYDNDDDDDDNLLSHIQKIIEENPEYNFTKFNENKDIKIALKD